MYIILLFGIATVGRIDNDLYWESFSLNENYLLLRDSYRELPLLYEYDKDYNQKKSLPDYILAFDTPNEYILLKAISTENLEKMSDYAYKSFISKFNDNVSTTNLISHYIIDTSNKEVIGPLDEEKFTELIEEKKIVFNDNWFKTTLLFFK